MKRSLIIILSNILLLVLIGFIIEISFIYSEYIRISNDLYTKDLSLLKQHIIEYITGFNNPKYYHFLGSLPVLNMEINHLLFY